MTIQRTEHVGIVVDDLAAATAFFIEFGLKLQDRVRAPAGRQPPRQRQWSSRGRIPKRTDSATS